MHHISCQHRQNPAAGTRSANPVAQQNRTGANQEGRQDGIEPMVTVVSGYRSDAAGQVGQIKENNVFQIGQMAGKNRDLGQAGRDHGHQQRKKGRALSNWALRTSNPDFASAPAGASTMADMPHGSADGWA
ncbi:MAG: hypothetical protein WC000_06870 [Dokdonella sp.]